MTHSAIRYGASDLYLNDATLRELLKALAWHLPARLAESANGIDEWLVVACDRWIDEHENLPPGLRDIELDETLTTAQKARSFARYLAWVRDRGGDGVYDEAVAREAIDAIVARLPPPRES